ncbi:uncharacterized protein LOC113510052 [Galleria mellonella]|uniref:Uncharacterized protein LOC113510052 n=1 Tax=Galleria mellonella TaxID=7137 RepID=A0ABM3N105_GALME|nr:uncharacterized protein LOC113510052 [Galleria mellonella]
MLCRKFKQIFFNRSMLNDKVQYYLLSSRLSKRCVLLDSLLTISRGERRMSYFRLTLKDLRVTRLWNVWRRNCFVSAVVKRCRKDVSVREMIQAFRHAILRPRRTLLLSATAAYNNHAEDNEPTPSCAESITDEELEALLTELDSVEELSKSTLFCTSCGKRLVVDKKQPGIRYCVCKDVPRKDESDGWVPYMEAEDVVIWRKEYKPGQGLYAYKVYGRYKEVRAEDFAAVQVDGAYRRVWDTAVAALSVVERRANGLRDQAVLHWEVLWPRLFANRDYVYIRRHKEFETTSRSSSHMQSMFDPPPSPVPRTQVDTQRPSVHSKAKRIAMENYEREKDNKCANKVFVIVSRSCEHADVPETKHAIRVSEYWSHMVVKTLNGDDKPGMEFVLTYYDEPAVGGLPSGVATWATGRAAPAYLLRMRRAAADYAAWRAGRADQDLPDYIPFRPSNTAGEGEKSTTRIKEEDMESSRQGPELENCEDSTRDQGTQTEDQRSARPSPRLHSRQVRVTAQNTSLPKPDAKSGVTANASPQEGDTDKQEEDSSSSNNSNSSWWRYLYPFYYFV